MKVNLLYSDRDFDTAAEPVSGSMDLSQDLGLDTVFAAMAGGDRVLFEVARKVLLSSLDDPVRIVFRQEVLDDCLRQPRAIRELHAIAVAAIEGEKQIWGFYSRQPAGILRRSRDSLEHFIHLLKKVRGIVDEQGVQFRSEGLQRLCGTLDAELDDQYFQELDQHLKHLRFDGGLLMSAELGRGNKGVDYSLRTPGERKPRWAERIGLGPRTEYSFEVSPRDLASIRALADLSDAGINPVANAVAQSADHIQSFFAVLRFELGFYVGCLNLNERLLEREEPTCFPVPMPWDPPSLGFRGLYDIGLALRLEEGVVGNDIDADGKTLLMITGANSGGKSTFLRSIGLAQLMMQSGMFVGAESFRGSVCNRLFTHFIREEDWSMTSGRLDEELDRMNVIVDRITPGSVVLFNESFAATNEREGSEIARQIVRALLESGVRVCFVTHLFDLAESLFSQGLATAIFVRAERKLDGSRTYRLLEGGPLPTSYGEDLYKRLIGVTAESVTNGPETVGVA
jgi:hypothetical protein